MPRKYTPVVMYDHTWYKDQPYYFGAMEESKYGQWVPLRVYLDETARLRKQIERLENETRRLNQKLGNPSGVVDATNDFTC